MSRRAFRSTSLCLISAFVLFATLAAPMASPAAAARGTITGVEIIGNRLNPLVRITGTELGAEPAPAHAGSPSEVCGEPKVGDTSKNYGSALYFLDTKAVNDPARVPRWAAGRSGGPYFSCIGLVIVSFTSTEVTFRFGPWYDARYYQLTEGDSIRVVVNGASLSTIADYQDRAPTIVAKGRVANAAVPTTVEWRPVHQDACYRLDLSQSYDDAYFDEYLVESHTECNSDGTHDMLVEPYLNAGKATQFRWRVTEMVGPYWLQSDPVSFVAGKYIPTNPAFRMLASWGFPIRGGGWPVSGHGVVGTSTILMCDAAGEAYVLSNEHVLGRTSSATFLVVDPPGPPGARSIRIGTVVAIVAEADIAVSWVAPYALPSHACETAPVVRIPEAAGGSGKLSPKPSASNYTELEVVVSGEPIRGMTVLWGGLTTGMQASVVRGVTDAECRDATHWRTNPSVCVDDGGYEGTSGAAFLHLIDDNRAELVGILSVAMPNKLDLGEYEAAGYPTSAFPTWLQLPS